MIVSEPVSHFPQILIHFQLRFIIANFEGGVVELKESIVYETIFLFQFQFFIIISERFQEGRKFSISFDQGLVLFKFGELERPKFIILHLKGHGFHFFKHIDRFLFPFITSLWLVLLRWGMHQLVVYAHPATVLYQCALLFYWRSYIAHICPLVQYICLF